MKRQNQPTKKPQNKKKKPSNPPKNLRFWWLFMTCALFYLHQPNVAKQPLTSFCPSSPNRIFHGGCTIWACAKYSTECWRKKSDVSALDTSSPLEIFQEHSFSHLIPPCAAWRSLFTLGGQGEVEKWALSVLTASYWGGSILIVILDVSGCAEEKGTISLLPFWWDTKPAWISGGVGMPQLLFFPSWKWTFRALPTRVLWHNLWVEAVKNELQWDFMLILVILGKKMYILI